MRRVRGQGGVRDKEEPVTRTCSTSPPDAAKLWLSSFDPGNNTPAGGLRIRRLPARPLNPSPRCRCTSVNAASGVLLPLDKFQFPLFCIITTVKKLQELVTSLLLALSWDLVVCELFFQV